MAASFYSGDYVGAVVADLGYHDTKIGWAGNDYPRSYFRSNVAVLREEAPKKQKDESTNVRRRPIVDIKYDYYHRPIEENSDGNWEVANPVNATTGLWYDPSHHQNNDGADWYDLMQHFIRHGYDSALKTKVEDHPLMLVERSYNPPPIRQQTLECLFEELHVPAAFLAKDAVLSCYACGRTTGTVVDIGYSGTTVSPVYEGYVEQKGIRRSPIGVLELDKLILEQMDQLLQRPVRPLYQVRNNMKKRSLYFDLAARLELAQHCRELGAGAAVNTTSSSFTAPHKSFELPDGTVLDIPSSNRFAVANLLLSDNNNNNNTSNDDRRAEILQAHQASWKEIIATASQSTEETTSSSTEETYSEAAAVGISKRRTKRTKASSTTTTTTSTTTSSSSFSNQQLQKACVSYLQTMEQQQLTIAPISNMVCDAAYKCDRDQQAALLGNVVLGGGGACLGPTEQAVPDLLRESIEGMIHTHTPNWRVKLLTPGLQERAILSWLGGSILGSLGTFHEMWITRAEYDEWGAAIVNRKCP